MHVRGRSRATLQVRRTHRAGSDQGILRQALLRMRPPQPALLRPLYVGGTVRQAERGGGNGAAPAQSDTSAALPAPRKPVSSHALAVPRANAVVNAAAVRKGTLSMQQRVAKRSAATLAAANMGATEYATRELQQAMSKRQATSSASSGAGGVSQREQASDAAKVTHEASAE